MSSKLQNFKQHLERSCFKAQPTKKEGELSFFQGISLKGLLCIVAYEELTSGFCLFCPSINVLELIG